MNRFYFHKAGPGRAIGTIFVSAVFSRFVVFADADAGVVAVAVGITTTIAVCCAIGATIAIVMIIVMIITKGGRDAGEGVFCDQRRYTSIR